MKVCFIMWVIMFQLEIKFPLIVVMECGGRDNVVVMVLEEVVVVMVVMLVVVVGGTIWHVVSRLVGGESHIQTVVSVMRSRVVRQHNGGAFVVKQFISTSRCCPFRFGEEEGGGDTFFSTTQFGLI